jgi:hypothetical protein
MGQRKLLGPGKEIENVLRIINQVMHYSGVKYWLCFGALWALIRNNGVVPDGDFDICTYYGSDYKRIEKAFAAAPGRYVMSKAVVDDIARDKALYCSFGSQEGYPHICLTFWYLHDGVRYYCHDQHHEVVSGVGVPQSGYFFRGVQAVFVEDDQNNFRNVEWPGVPQINKIRVPRFAGTVLDTMYPDWAFKKQHYEVRNGVVDIDKMMSYHKGGAISPYAVHVQSMKDFENSGYIKRELEKSKRAWEIRLKNGE